MKQVAAPFIKPFKNKNIALNSVEQITNGTALSLSSLSSFEDRKDHLSFFANTPSVCDVRS